MTDELLSVLNNLVAFERSIRIKDFTKRESLEYSSCVLWEYESKGVIHICRLGDRLFKRSSGSEGVIVDTGDWRFDFEIKLIGLCLLHYGARYGSESYKWRTVKSRLRVLCRLAKFLKIRSVSSFREFGKLSELRQRNYVLDFMYQPREKGGMNAEQYSSAFKSLREGCLLLATYGFTKLGEFRKLVDELTLQNIQYHEDESRLRHAVIPTQVLKGLLVESCQYIENACSKIRLLEKYNEHIVKLISTEKASEYKSLYHRMNSKINKDYFDLYDAFFKDLRPHVFKVVLAFTGMRLQEVLAIRINSGRRKVEDGESVFSLRTLLTKTDNSEIELDWICNKETYDAVNLLSKICQLQKYRSEALIESHGKLLTKQNYSNHEKIVETNRLFSICYSRIFPRYGDNYKLAGNAGGLSLNRQEIRLTSQDIYQLEVLGCNYKSVSAHSGKRGIPYKEGDIFHFTAHQFRHTFAWFIVANRLGELDDIKYQFKHLRQAMTFVYSERGYETLDAFLNVVEDFESQMTEIVINDLVNYGQSNQLAGGGGRRLTQLIASLNKGEDITVFSEDMQAHFSDLTSLQNYILRHSESIRGLPHGYCTKGPACKIKNAADPSHCLYCDTYFVTPKHLPYWKSIAEACRRRLEKIEELSDEAQQQYHALSVALKTNLLASSNIVNDLEHRDEHIGANALD